jgi:DNA-binding MarR family transcriptional regulator
MLARIGRVAGGMLGAALQPTGLKPRHIVALAALRERALTQSALGDAADVDATKLVGLLNDLETAGLITRTRDRADRRRHIVALSDAGRARLEAVDAATRGVEERLTAGLDAAQRAYLGALLSHLATNAAAVGNASGFEADEDGERCPTT